MKKLLLIPLLLLAGCTFLDKAYTKQVTAVPGAIIATNTVIVTNTIWVPAITNSVGVVTPPEVRSVLVPTISLTYAPPTYVTNLIPNSTVTTTFDVAKDIPVPYVGLIGSILGMLYAGYAAWRNKKGVTALVQGVEETRKLLQETPIGQEIDKKVKDFLIKHQEMNGVLDLVSKEVDKTTDNTVK